MCESEKFKALQLQKGQEPTNRMGHHQEGIPKIVKTRSVTVASIHPSTGWFGYRAPYKREVTIWSRRYTPAAARGEDRASLKPAAIFARKPRGPSSLLDPRCWRNLEGWLVGESPSGGRVGFCENGAPPPGRGIPHPGGAHTHTNERVYVQHPHGGGFPTAGSTRRVSITVLCLDNAIITAFHHIPPTEN